MARGYVRDEDRLGPADVLDGLPRHRFRQEADEIDRMAGAQRHADFAVGLHAADSGTVARARIDDNDRRLRGIGRHVRRRNDAHERVVDRALQLAAVEHELGLEGQDMRDLLRRLRERGVAPLVQRLQKQHAPLPRVRPIFGCRA